MNVVGTGTIDVATAVDERTVVLAGIAAAPPPSSGVLEREDGSPIGRCSAHAWRTDADGGLYRFVALIDVENVIHLSGDPLHLAPDAGGERHRLPPIGRLGLDISRFLAWLGDHGANLRASVFEFLRVQMRESGLTARSARARAFVHELMSRISTRDGVIEIFARFEDGGLLLQGWGVHLGARVQACEVETRELRAGEIAVCHFSRGDLLDNACGFSGLFSDAGDLQPQDVRRLYFREGEAFYHLDVLDQRVVLEGAAAVTHVRQLFSQLRGEPVSKEAFRLVCRERFDGRETVSALAHPVRMAVDSGLLVERGGLFLSGWMLDPTRRVSAVHVRSSLGFSARLDGSWQKLPRSDVTQGFSGDPLFAGRLDPEDHMHGFMAFVPYPGAGAAPEQFFLELTLGADGSSAFLPVAAQDSLPQERMRQLLSGLNLNDPAVETLIARHVGPVVVAAYGRRSPPPAVQVSAEFGAVARTPRVSIVMPILGDRSDVDVNLAPLALDPELREAEIVVVGSRGAGDPIAAALSRHARFLGLDGRLLLSLEPLDYHRALEAGVAAARGGHVLLMAPNVLPKDKGWLSRLLDAFAADPKAGTISPTLLYEDYSIRFAGRDVMLADSAGLKAPSVSRFAGYSRDWLARGGTEAVGGITTECCLMPQRLLAALGGFAREFVGRDCKDDDFSLRLRGAGLNCLWTSAVELFAVDETDEHGEPENLVKVGRMVDRWAFARKWPAVPAPEGGP